MDNKELTKALRNISEGKIIIAVLGSNASKEQRSEYKKDLKNKFKLGNWSGYEITILTDLIQSINHELTFYLREVGGNKIMEELC